MVPTALPRSYIGQYTRFRVEIESHNAIGDEKKKIPYRKKPPIYTGYYYVKSGNYKQKALQNTIPNILIWGGVLIILTNIIINSFSYALPL